MRLEVEGLRLKLLASQAELGRSRAEVEKLTEDLKTMILQLKDHTERQVTSEQGVAIRIGGAHRDRPKGLVEHRAAHKARGAQGCESAGRNIDGESAALESSGRVGDVAPSSIGCAISSDRSTLDRLIFRGS